MSMDNYKHRLHNAHGAELNNEQVIDSYEDFCLREGEYDWHDIMHCRNPSEKVMIAAINKHPDAINYIKDPPLKLIAYNNLKWGIDAYQNYNPNWTAMDLRGVEDRRYYDGNAGIKR